MFAVGALVFCGEAFHLDNADISIAATLLLSIVGFMVLYKISQPMNTLRTIILIGNMVALVFTGVQSFICFRSNVIRVYSFI